MEPGRTASATNARPCGTRIAVAFDAAAGRPSRPWPLLLWALLACAPSTVQAQDLTGLRVLPHAGAGSTFSGWQSEGEVPSALDVPLDLGDEVYGATL